MDGQGRDDKATPEEAVAWAQKEIELIYKKWSAGMNRCEQRGGRIELLASRNVSASVILANVDTDRARQLQPAGRGGQL